MAWAYKKIISNESRQTFDLYVILTWHTDAEVAEEGDICAFPAHILSVSPSLAPLHLMCWHFTFDQ